MTEDQLKELLRSLWYREISADEAFDLLELEMESPNEDSKEYWIRIVNS
jgi:hypothetical protein